MMTFFAEISFIEVMFAAIAVGMIDRAACRFLPDHIAGPGGWLLDTEADDANA